MDGKEGKDLKARQGQSKLQAEDTNDDEEPRIACENETVKPLIRRQQASISEAFPFPMWLSGDDNPNGCSCLLSSLPLFTKSIDAGCDGKQRRSELILSAAEGFYYFGLSTSVSVDVFQGLA